ncbi:MAG: aminotransferase class V-fold PLP-dependent enzyme [Bryobacterales bacterium]|jgi:8-amino-3,8-dideoxy-alpha-D-manno-octulosonate transaminase|nr:aminotransferase class V-fold PLP-dependent enzyme [Bryobacterales bacterium]
MVFSRRLFLGSAAALATTPASARLAIDGGTPVRAKPLQARLYGPLYYNQMEWDFLREVWEARAPFRFWGMDRSVMPAKVATFEREFATFMQTRFALGVTSGTAALQVALAALEIGPGDEVIVPAWTWHSCFNAVVMAGALPICAEIDSSFNLDPADVERHITPRTRVLMAVHLQGNPANMEALLAIARKHKLRVLEDVSQSVGASYRGKPLGKMGDIAIASLQVNKTISAGEGGAVYTSDAGLFERAIRFHDVGTVRAPHTTWLGSTQGEAFIGVNYRMNEFSGAVLLAQIRKLPQVVGDIRAVARRVYEGIADLKQLELRGLPDPAGELGSAVFVGFPGRSQRDRFLSAMKAENVPASPPSGSVLLPTQPHIIAKRATHPNWPTWTSPAGRAVRYGVETCPRSAAILDRFAGVSLDPKFTEADTRDIVNAIRKVHPAIMAG